MTEALERGGINWDALRESLPASSHELVDGLRHACESNPTDLARAVSRKLTADLGRMRHRFDQISQDGDS